MSNEDNNNKKSMHQNIFKYGPPAIIKTLSTSNRSVTFGGDVSKSEKDIISKQIQRTIVSQNVVKNFTQVLGGSNVFNEIVNNEINNQFINNVNNVTNNITNVIGDTNFFTEIVNNEINTNIVNNINNITNNITTVLGNTQVFNNVVNNVINTEVTINNITNNLNQSTTFNETVNNIVNTEIINNITNISQYVTETTVFNENVTNIISETFHDMTNTISPWCITDDYDLYTYATVTLNADITVKDSIYITNSNNRLYVLNDHLYFNECNLTQECDPETVTFYFNLNYSATNLTTLESTIKTALLVLDTSIDFTNLEFTFSDSSIKVVISMKSGLTSIQKEIAITDLKSIYSITSEENLTITIDGSTVTNIANIYFLNTYYYFPTISRNNAFKLLKRYDTSNTGALKSGMQVFIQDIHGKYLQQDDYSFTATSAQDLILKVHGFTNSFLTSTGTTEVISIKDGFKLETLPPVLIDSTPDNIIVGSSYLTDPAAFEQDATWTNIGVNPTYLTDGLFLSANIEDWIEDASVYNTVYLVDERWLTYTEVSASTVGTFSYTFNDDQSNSKKFINGTVLSGVADYVFNDNYNLETIEDHGNYMFNKKHLPSVASNNNYNSFIKIFKSEQRVETILEELEKAHVYIYQLNKKIKKQDDEINFIKNTIKFLTPPF